MQKNLIKIEKMNVISCGFARTPQKSQGSPAPSYFKVRPGSNKAFKKNITLIKLPEGIL